MPCEPCSMCFYWPLRIIEANQIAFNIMNAEVGGRFFIPTSLKFSLVYIFSSLLSVMI